MSTKFNKHRDTKQRRKKYKLFKSLYAPGFEHYLYCWRHKILCLKKQLRFKFIIHIKLYNSLFLLKEAKK